MCLPALRNKSNPTFTAKDLGSLKLLARLREVLDEPAEKGPKKDKKRKHKQRKDRSESESGEEESDDSRDDDHPRGSDETRRKQ